MSAEEKSIPGLTELENKLLHEDPINMISFLQVKYSNNSLLYQRINNYIIAHDLTSHKDSWGREIIMIKPFYNTDNEYMMYAIETDNIALFEPIFTHEIQKVMLNQHDLKNYVMSTINDCINHDSVSCLENIIKNAYITHSLPVWLTNISITGYWFPAVARHGKVIDLLFVRTSVINNMEPLERTILGCMVTESAIKTCNKAVFNWCISVFWRNIDYLSSEYAKEPYLNEAHLKIFHILTDD